MSSLKTSSRCLNITNVVHSNLIPNKLQIGFSCSVSRTWTEHEAYQHINMHANDCWNFFLVHLCTKQSGCCLHCNYIKVNDGKNVLLQAQITIWGREDAEHLKAVCCGAEGGFWWNVMPNHNTAWGGKRKHVFLFKARHGFSHNSIRSESWLNFNLVDSSSWSNALEPRKWSFFLLSLKRDV